MLCVHWKCLRGNAAQLIGFTFWLPFSPESWPLKSWLSCWLWIPIFVFPFLWDDKSAAQLFVSQQLFSAWLLSPYTQCICTRKYPKEKSGMECWTHLSEFLLSLGSCKSWLKSFQCLQTGFFFLILSHFCSLFSGLIAAVVGSGTRCILLLQHALLL